VVDPAGWPGERDQRAVNEAAPNAGGEAHQLNSDLLLHRIGSALADGMTDGSADSTAWRTTPLIGLRFVRVYLHDGRAASVADAILAHDGEAEASADAFRALSADDRQTLITSTSRRPTARRSSPSAP
jgi:CxxC motif-containing protein (DUF1111 family)